MGPKAHRVATRPAGLPAALRMRPFMRGEPRRAASAIAASLVMAVLLAVFAGCAPLPRGADRLSVSLELLDRTGYGCVAHAGGRAPPAAGAFTALASGERLTEERAIDLALLNNAAFQETLADLGLSQADLVQAGLISNPDALLRVPVGAK